MDESTTVFLPLEIKKKVILYIFNFEAMAKQI